MIRNVGMFLSLSFSIFSYSQDYLNKKNVITTYQSDSIYSVLHVDKLPKFAKRPKNIIVMIGDGMGVSQIFSGITANGGSLNLMNFPVCGFSLTQSANKFITESAAAATAIATGQRTNNDYIAVDVNKNKLKTMLEVGKERGKSTGLIATNSITDATPACFVAHQPSRKMQNEIALNIVKSDITLFIGGGRKFFNNRPDHLNLIDSLKNRGYTVADSMKKIENITGGKLAVIVSDQETPVVKIRKDFLPSATSKSLDILNKNKKGFFVMIEGSQIDWGGHENDLPYLVTEMVDFDQAVGNALKFALKDKNTLIVVLADHETGGLSILGGDMKKGIVKAGFSSNNHTAVMVPVFAIGPGAENFGGIYNNTEIFNKIMRLWK